jgi:DNA-binding CsgD family transcriptional regulator
MSNIQMLFTDPAGRRAARSAPDPAEAKTFSGLAGRSTEAQGAEADRELRALLWQRTAETEELQSLFCSLNLPILHLSADLRLCHFSQAAAQLFGLASADLGGCLDLCWPTAPKRALAEACRTGVPCGHLSKGPDGRDWQCQIMPRTLRQGVPASVLVILVASLATVPAGPSACQEKNDLTPRQRQVMNLVLAGHPSKNIAADLKISQRTVENHRAAIMQRTGATSLPALARIAVGASVYADQRLRHGLRILPDLRA